MMESSNPEIVGEYYPPPEEHPTCLCKGNPLKAMFCPFGHMLECHHPLSCSQARCQHLTRYHIEDGE